MKNEIYEILNFINKYGGLSQPLVNYLMNQVNDNDIKLYIKVLIAITKSYSKKELLNIINTSIDECFDKNIKYLLMGKKLNILGLLQDKRAYSLYNYLKSELDKMNVFVRKNLSGIFLNFESNSNINLKKIRLWSNVYKEDKSTYIFYLIGQARSLISKNDYKKAISIYLKSANLALELPNPNAILLALNNSAWYLKEINSKKADIVSKKLVYYLFYFREDLNKYLSHLDTYYQIQLLNKDIRYVFTLYFIELYYDSDLFKFDKTYDYKLNQYKVDENIINYIKYNIKSINSVYKKADVSNKTLSMILNNNIKYIKSNTIKKLLNNLDFTIDFNTPPCFIKEHFKIKIDNDFDFYKNEFKKLNFKNRIINFMSLYMSMTKREKDLYWNLKEKILNIIKSPSLFNKSMKKNYYTKFIFINMYDTHEFILPKKLLVEKFLKKLTKKDLIKFVLIYSNLSEKDRYLIDKFIRNNSRYNNISNIDISSNDIIKKFSKVYKIDYKSNSYSYWAFDKINRKKILNIIKKFN